MTSNLESSGNDTDFSSDYDGRNEVLIERRKHKNRVACAQYYQRNRNNMLLEKRRREKLRRETKKLNRCKWDPPKKLKPKKLKAYHGEEEAMKDDSTRGDLEPSHNGTDDSLSGRTQAEQDAVASLNQLASGPQVPALTQDNLSSAILLFPLGEHSGGRSRKAMPAGSVPALAIQKSAEYYRRFPADLPPSSEDEEDAEWRLQRQHLQSSSSHGSSIEPFQNDPWKALAPEYDSSDSNSTE
ncbi:hypothetical protein C8J57DRAFT_1542397 [Mycena rebaudengoi]|nr:hypothetical protein C8J57DRAFT_1542397 [Mycena rebaudengoi]